MRMFRIATIFIFIFSVCPYALAETPEFTKWGNLMDVAYKFTWYPTSDLQELLKTKSDEYGKSLEDYCGFLTDELTNGPSKTEFITPESFVTGKDWKMYYKLAVAQFCLFLSNGKDIHLENAKSAISVVSGKMALSNVAFWHHMFQAYYSLQKKDRDTFVSSVFGIWEDVVLKLEVDDILMMGSRDSKPELVKSLPFLYENLAHVIITRAIFDKSMTDLYPLGVIVVSINKKLTVENGYKSIVESIVERMHGLKSDCSNLNFAVAFVEATANQYDFEDEKSASLVVSKYNLARAYYEMAISWSNTLKGKAAILTQSMGFNNYIIRRLIDKDDLLASNPFFNKIPEEGNKLAVSAMELYAQLAQSENRESDIEANGFDDKKNYYTAMHQLWDSMSKLLMMQSAYYKSVYKPNELDKLHVAEGPLLQYLTFFKKNTATDSAIVPDSAFFLAAYAEKEMAELYRQASSYSTKIEINDLAFEHQLKAIKMFPMDITGILKLAHQTNQEGRLNLYWQEAGPVASNFSNSKVSSIWAEKVEGDNKAYINVTMEVVPDIINKASFLVKVLQQSSNTDSEEDLCRKTIILTKLLMAFKKNHSDEKIEKALASLAKLNLNGKKMDDIIKTSLPANMVDEAKAVPGIDIKYDFAGLKNELFSSTDHVIHSYLRALYYENGGI